ncbi:response regulator [uncultured Bacteroides sp.]|uniref:response regulator n=1 Tax=uncultured Bacteroides sp. TaxID=162156 RepID=UPI00272C7CAA|nr:response regulator [uncultured Bacteroides sp.]
MGYKILYIEDENANSIKSDIESDGISVDVLQPTGFEMDLNKLCENTYDAFVMDFRLTAGVGKVDAPTFATTLRTEGANQKKVPIIMISTERNLPHFENDSTSQDLFDIVIGKEAFRRNHQKYTTRIKSFIEAYRTIAQCNFDIKTILDIDDISELDYRFIFKLESYKSRGDIYGYLRFINNSLVRAIGPLVGPEVLAARLGIDINEDDKNFQKLVTMPEFTKCKYTGVLSNTYNRWWFDKIQILWQSISPVSLRRTIAKGRVDILNQQYNLKLRYAIPLEMATSSTFWTICHEYKKPLDPTDGYQFRNRHLDEWLEPEYISLKGALEFPSKQEFLSPLDKEEVRSLGKEANERE